MKMDPKLRAIQRINKILADLDLTDRGVVLGYVQHASNVEQFKAEVAEKRAYVGALNMQTDATDTLPGLPLVGGAVAGNSY